MKGVGGWLLAVANAVGLALGYGNAFWAESGPESWGGGGPPPPPPSSSDSLPPRQGTALPQWLRHYASHTSGREIEPGHSQSCSPMTAAVRAAPRRALLWEGAAPGWIPFHAQCHAGGWRTRFSDANTPRLAGASGGYPAPGSEATLGPDNCSTGGGDESRGWSPGLQDMRSRPGWVRRPWLPFL